MITMSTFFLFWLGWKIQCCWLAISRIYIFLMFIERKTSWQIPFPKKCYRWRKALYSLNFWRMDLYYHRIRSKIFSYSSLRIPKVYFMCFLGACQWIFRLHTLFWPYFVSFCFSFLVYLSLYLLLFISLNVNFLLSFLLCNISTYLHILSIYGMAFVCEKNY